MKHSQNYQLCQWEPEDRIQREDFNADNAKVDAALAGLAGQVAGKAAQKALDAEKAAREAADAEISGRAGTRLLWSHTYTAEGTDWSVNLSTVNWTEWATVRVLFLPQLDGGAYTIYLNGSTMQAAANDVNTASQVVLFPTFTPELPVSGICPTSNYAVGFFTATPYGSFTTLRYFCRGGKFLPGTKAQIWGCK